VGSAWGLGKAGEGRNEHNIAADTNIPFFKTIMIEIVSVFFTRGWSSDSLISQNGQMIEEAGDFGMS